MTDSNPSQPAAVASSTNKSWWLVLIVVAFCGWMYADIFGWLARTWQTNPDYSHGWLVVLFSLYLLWAGRKKLASLSDSGSPLISDGLWWGVALLVAGLLLRLVGIYMRVLTFEALSLIPFLLGALGILLGRRAMLWALPALLFLVFTVPLPGFLAGRMSGGLQAVATSISTFFLQTAGVPAIADGNIISLSNGEIGVAEACSGLRMLYAFFALTVGACLVIDRSLIEKLAIGMAAVPIAIAVNCIRIVATGLAYEHFGAETAEKIFHDVAGWVMMPMGFAILLGGLAILERLIIDDGHRSQLGSAAAR
ncbi:exosortase/archaeosortase family protein [Aureliella helgolandensis]|uniref:Transmembrane exosortase (Exosortase_EpsH) n=1 Tax=Aureliella helgolandensis TaxID=2527968 RepID=A0A518GFH6_9BACT|nr:exosortase/archaeosortase family protein [Aureliella helgolandensis]QDV27310.1 Transmembrane exosortase (Exosortase_EpsH) [Aureliella helgolandensis]